MDMAKLMLEIETILASRYQTFAKVGNWPGEVRHINLENRVFIAQFEDVALKRYRLAKIG
jgi:hypothetical protein